MNYRINWDDGVFAVPDKVTECMKLATAKSLKVLLYLLRYKRLPEDPAEIGVSAEDIGDALSYWQQTGIIGNTGTAVIPVPESTDVPSEKPQVKILAKPPEEAAKPEPPKPRTVIKPQKSLLPSEIAERIEKSEEVAFLFKSAEGCLRRVLTFDDQRTILWFYDHLGMSADIITMLIAYCCSIERFNMGYIEKIALDWHEKSIITHEQAENEILIMQKKFSFEGRVQSRLRLQSKLTASQKKYIGDWALWDMDIDTVELAYDKTVDATGKPAFGYMNKILMKWHENGITSAQAAAEFDERTKPAPKEKATGNKKAEYGQKTDNSSSSAPSFDLSLILEHAKNSTPTV